MQNAMLSLLVREAHQWAGWGRGRLLVAFSETGPNCLQIYLNSSQGAMFSPQKVAAFLAPGVGYCKQMASDSWGSIQQNNSNFCLVY